MIHFFNYKWNRIGVRIAIGSFIIGTLLMLIALISTNDIILTIGIVFMVIYIPITAVLLFILAINAICNIRGIYEHAIVFICVTMNLPIALLYINFLNL